MEFLWPSEAEVCTGKYLCGLTFPQDRRRKHSDFLIGLSRSGAEGEKGRMRLKMSAVSQTSKSGDIVFIILCYTCSLLYKSRG